MPTNHKVSVGWQIVAQFILVADLWSAYRIRKLRSYVMYVVLPHVANSVVFGYFIFLNSQEYSFFGNGERPSLGDPTNFVVQIVSPVVSFAILAAAIYLIITWSREHNRKIDSATPPHSS